MNECIHEERWEKVLEDLEALKKNNGKWVRWAVPLVAGLTMTVYGILEKADAEMDRKLSAFIMESTADRRHIAEQQAGLDTRQREQFDRIIAEIEYVKQKIDRISP